MTSDKSYTPTIDRALQVERYLLAHRAQILKIEHLLHSAGQVDLSAILRHLLVVQCVTTSDAADLIEAAIQARGPSRKKVGPQTQQRFLDDFKRIKRQRASYKKTQDSKDET